MIEVDRASRIERFAVIGEVSAAMAHELRNTLQVVSATAYLARQDPAHSLPYIEKVERFIQLAQRIVDEFMALARGEPVFPEPTEFAEVLREARAEIPDGIVWVDTIEPEGLEIPVQPILFARLLRVLFDNAHGMGARCVRTLARQDASGFTIDVRDDGPGVPSSLAPKIFDALVSERPGGTGLGLALVRRIAEAHGGSVTLETLAPQSALFRIRLPRSLPAVDAKTT